MSGPYDSRCTPQGSISSTFYRQLLHSSLTPILLAHSGECKSWANFLAMCTSKVGHIFFFETEWHLLALKNDYQHLCALCHKVGEIDTTGCFFYFGMFDMLIIWSIFEQKSCFWTFFKSTFRSYFVKKIWWQNF